MPLESIRKVVQKDFDAVNQFIKDNLRSKLNLIEALSQHLINSGGKRIRPLLLLLGVHAWNYSGKKHIGLAAVIEYFHTATLLHDDVVDDSKLRRGHKTANMLWGDKASILVGDYLFLQSFQITLKHSNPKILAVLIDAAATITRGEVQQYMNRHNIELSELDYMEVIHNKTAVLFSAAAQIGALLADRSEKEIDAMINYGKYIGNAFQLIDDALDYCASSDAIGKNIGDDLAQGKLTLPLIHAFNNGTKRQQQLITESIQNNNVDNLPGILEAIEQTNAIDYTQQVAHKHMNKAILALEIIPDSQYKGALIELAQYAVHRKH